MALQALESKRRVVYNSYDGLGCLPVYKERHLDLLLGLLRQCKMEYCSEVFAVTTDSQAT